MDLEEFTSYNYSVAAATTVGVGVFITAAQFTTYEDGMQILSVEDAFTCAVCFYFSKLPTSY